MLMLKVYDPEANSTFQLIHFFLPKILLRLLVGEAEFCHLGLPQTRHYSLLAGANCG